MGKLLSFRLWRQILRPTLFIASFALGAASLYQNCSSGAGVVGPSGKSGVTVNSALAAQPIPVQMQFNQISVMTCAQAGLNAIVSPDPLANPYYHFRFGGFDNTLFKASPGPLETQGTFLYSQGGAITGNLGGLSFSTAAMNYMRSESPTPTTQMLQTYLQTSPYTNGAQPVAAIIYPNGSRSTSLAPTFGLASAGSSAAATSLNPVATSLLQPFSGSQMTTELANAVQLPNAGTLPSGYFYTIGGSAGQLLGSLSFPINQVSSLPQFLNQYLLYAGFSNSTAGAAGIIQNMASPDNNPAKRLFGVGYQFTPTIPYGNPGYFYLEGGFLHSSPYPNVNQVHEFDLAPANGSTQPVDLTAQNNEQWDCFHLTVVRDVDRKYYTVPANVTTGINFYMTNGQACGANATATTQDPTCLPMFAGEPVHPSLVTTLQGNAFPLQENYFTSAADVANFEGFFTQSGGAGGGYSSALFFQNGQTAGYGTYYPTIPFTLTSAGGQTQGYNPYPAYNPLPLGTHMACPHMDISSLNAAQLDQLHIIRRFLSTDNWDVNVAMGCAVPTSTATSSGAACYLNGDGASTATALPVQYSNMASTSCGPGSSKYGECPATVSFCVRYR